MFIGRSSNESTNSVRRSGMVLSGKAILEFRSSERSRRNLARRSINMLPLRGEGVNLNRKQFLCLKITP
jgi:hypothetical protein